MRGLMSVAKWSTPMAMAVVFCVIFAPSVAARSCAELLRDDVRSSEELSSGERACQEAILDLPLDFCLSRPNSLTRRYLEHPRNKPRIERYFQACTPRDWGWLRQQRKSTADVVGRLVGAILRRTSNVDTGADWYVHCMGFRVDTRHIVTARHCVTSARTGNVRPFLPQLRFHLLAEPELAASLEVAGILVKRPDWPDVEDWILLAADTSEVALPDEFGPSWLETPPEIASDPQVVRSEAFEALILGPNVYGRIQADGGDSAFDRVIRYDAVGKSETETDRRSTCRVIDYDGSVCIVHSCQTMGSFSGSPVFVSTNFEPRFRLFGIHLSSGLGRLNDSCAGAELRNNAIRLPVAVRELARQAAAGGR
jgi:hypothetical protein